MPRIPLRAHLRAACSVAVFGAIAMPSVVTALFVPGRSLTAQEPRPRPMPAGAIYVRPADRAALGVIMAAGSRADTAGVRLEEVEPNSPAARAGLEPGDIITEVNGTSLRVAREDAEDLAFTGLAQRRLQRALAKVKPGDEVTLRVRSGSAAARTVTIRTVSQAELDRDATRRVSERTVLRERLRVDTVATARGMVGITIGGAGNARDTLGLFVNSVVSGGPAEQAGIVEGERIAAVNGVDVRLPKEDADDPQVRSSRIDRFLREVGKVEPGQKVTLRVYGGGRYRDVAVTAARSTGQGAVRIFRGDGAAPRVFEFDLDGEIGRLRLDGRELRIDGEQLRRSIEEMRRGVEEGVREGLRGFELRMAPDRARRAASLYPSQP
jgi:serine protease Do